MSDDLASRLSPVWSVGLDKDHVLQVLDGEAGALEVARELRAERGIADP